MGSLLISIPDIADDNLIFDERETSDIARFFWWHVPIPANQPVSNDVRRVAQTALIAAIEGTFAIGFVEGLLETLTFRTSTKMSAMAKKLLKSYTGHTWKHVTRDDKNLKEIRIAESVRSSVSSGLVRHLQIALSEQTVSRSGWLRLCVSVPDGAART